MSLENACMICFKIPRKPVEVDCSLHHQVHMCCIRKWFKRNEGYDLSCPMCERKITCWTYKDSLNVVPLEESDNQRRTSVVLQEANQRWEQKSVLIIQEMHAQIKKQAWRHIAFFVSIFSVSILLFAGTAATTCTQDDKFICSIFSVIALSLLIYGTGYYSVTIPNKKGYFYVLKGHDPRRYWLKEDDRIEWMLNRKLPRWCLTDPHHVRELKQRISELRVPVLKHTSSWKPNEIGYLRDMCDAGILTEQQKDEWTQCVLEYEAINFKYRTICRKSKSITEPHIIKQYRLRRAFTEVQKKWIVFRDVLIPQLPNPVER